MGKQITSSFFLKKKKSSKFIKKYPVKQHKTPLNLKKRITRLKEFKKFKFKNLLKKSNIFNKLYQLHKSYKFISKFIKSPFHLKKKN